MSEQCTDEPLYGMVFQRIIVYNIITEGLEFTDTPIHLSKLQ